MPIRRIFEEFDQIVAASHARMSNCATADGQLCETGCYACLKSYHLHQYAYAVHKPTALMFTGYLLGHNPFVPAIPGPTLAPSQFDLTLRLERLGNRYIVHSPTKPYEAVVTEDQNATIFNLLTHAIQSEFSEDTRTLRILAREEYIIEAINKGSLNKSKDAFAHFQFNALRFQLVLAERSR